MGVTAAVMAGTSAAVAIGSAYSQSQAQKQQAAFQQMQYEQNAKIADVQSDDAVKRGEREAAGANLKTRRLVGAQKVAAAGSGVDSSSGSAGALESEAEGLGALDQLTIRSNAWREAWGYRAQALSSRTSGSFAVMAGQNQSNNTLLTGGMQAMNYAGNAAYYYNGGAKADTKADSPGTPRG